MDDMSQSHMAGAPESLIVTPKELKHRDRFIITEPGKAIYFQAADDDADDDAPPGKIFVCQCIERGWNCAGVVCSEQCLKWKCEWMDDLPPNRL